jgi:catechol 2,3-dioxygenase
MTTVPLDIDGVLAAGSGDLPEAANGVVVGHAHLKVADVQEAVSFWTADVGMELMTRFGADAAFLADDGYHHHIGANSWHSRGRPLEPQEGPGLDYVAIGGGSSPRELTSPDGVQILVEP